jgi:DNA-binding transcriptional MocR family regulator
MVAATTTVVEELFSERARMAGRGPVGLDPRGIERMISFAGGYPDAGSMPVQDLLESARIALERDGKWALQYAFGSGVPELVEQVRVKLARDQGIRADVPNILITNGASEGIGLIFELLVNPGDVVLTEAPWFLGAIAYAQHCGAEMREIPLDEGGLDIARLEQELDRLRAEGRRAKFLYLVPNFQNPTGVTYTLERRKRIVELAQEHGVPILVDDAYFDLRFEGEKLPPLYTLDDTGLVMYAGTFSKILGAGVRLGWIIADATVIGHLSGLKLDYGTGAFTSHVAAQFAASGTLVEHIAQLRPLYGHRRDVMLAALAESMPEGVSWSRPAGGFFIWLTLPEHVSGEAVTAEAQKRGVTVSPGTQFHYSGGGEHHLRLAYSFTDDDQTRRGVQILGEIVREQLG